MSSSSSIIWLSLHHHLTWCQRQSITSSWNLSTNVSWSSSTSWALPSYISNSWWEIPSSPLNGLCYHRPLYCLLFHTNLFMFCVIPWDPCYPAFVLLYLGVLPSFMSRMSWEFHHLLRILDTGDTFCISVHSLVPVLFLTGKPTIELWCATSKLLATLLLRS